MIVDSNPTPEAPSQRRLPKARCQFRLQHWPASVLFIHRGSEVSFFFETESNLSPMRKAVSFSALKWRVEGHHAIRSEVSTSLNCSNFSDLIPSEGVNFFSFVDPIRQLESVKLVFLSASIEPFNITKVGQSNPMAFSDAPRATRVNNF